MLTSFLS